MNGQEFELGVLEIVRRCRKNTFAAHFVWLIEIADLLAAEVDQRERDTAIG